MSRVYCTGPSYEVHIDNTKVPFIRSLTRGKKKLRLVLDDDSAVLDVPTKEADHILAFVAGAIALARR